MSDKKSYLSYVEKARELVQQRDELRWKICKMAVYACNIQLGGQIKGFYTLTKFADDIGMNSKTLSEWVLQYKTVYLSIEKHKRKGSVIKDIVSAHDKVRRKGLTRSKNEQEIRDIYCNEARICPEDRAIQEAKTRMRHFVGIICNEYVLNLLVKEDLLDIKVSADVIKSTIDSLLEIRQSCEKISDKIKEEVM